MRKAVRGASAAIVLGLLVVALAPPVTAGAIAGAHLTLSKTASATSGPVPLSVTYTYKLLNDGSEIVFHAAVTDDGCPVVAYQWGDADNDQLVDPGETWTFGCSRTYSAAGTYPSSAKAAGTSTATGLPVTSNQAQTTVTAGSTTPTTAPATTTTTAKPTTTTTAPPATTTTTAKPTTTATTLAASTTITGGHMTLSRTANTTSGAVPLAVTSTYALKNDGTQVVFHAAVTDDGCSPVAYKSGDADNDQLLDPGETWSFSCSRTYSSAGTYTSTAGGNGTSTATGLPVTSNQVPATVTAGSTTTTTAAPTTTTTAKPVTTTTTAKPVTTTTTAKPATTTTTVKPATTTTTAKPVTTTTTAKPVTTTTTVPVSGPSTLRAVGTAILSDADAAARVKRSTWEPRPTNSVQNQTVPTAAELTTFNSHNGTGQWGDCDFSHRAKVTGNFKGTTDEIIQWAAWKWGLPEATLRAVAVKESWWRMEALGDSGQSFGLTQVKNASFHAGTYPLSKNSTAFNADYHAGIVRQYFDGCSSWLTNYSYNGTRYAAGDFWGSIGTWFSGDWHGDSANAYITDVKNYEAARTWAQAGF